MTPDHVNPEAPWPHLDELARRTAETGKVLVQRLPVYPAYVRGADRWLAPTVATAGAAADRTRRAWRARTHWAPGDADAAAGSRPCACPASMPASARIVERATSGERLGEDEIVRLFAARDADYAHITQRGGRAAQGGQRRHRPLRRQPQHQLHQHLHLSLHASAPSPRARRTRRCAARPTTSTTARSSRRAVEAWDRGATEVCLQGGIHPDYTGATYDAICRAIKAAVPDMHIHAFSPLEVTQGAATLGLPLRDFLAQLKAAGLGTLPGTAAEILDDEVRAIICPDKVNTAQWLDVVRDRARARPAHHLAPSCSAMSRRRCTGRATCCALRDLQAETGGFTEFVPLPFVHMEAPMYLQRPGAQGPDLPRGGADAFRRAAGAAPADHQHPDVLGEDGAGGRGAVPATPAPTTSAAR